MIRFWIDSVVNIFEWEGFAKKVKGSSSGLRSDYWRQRMCWKVFGKCIREGLNHQQTIATDWRGVWDISFVPDRLGVPHSEGLGGVFGVPEERPRTIGCTHTLHKGPCLPFPGQSSIRLRGQPITVTWLRRAPLTEVGGNILLGLLNTSTTEGTHPRFEGLCLLVRFWLPHSFIINLLMDKVWLLLFLGKRMEAVSIWGPIMLALCIWAVLKYHSVDSNLIFKIVKACKPATQINSVQLILIFNRKHTLHFINMCTCMVACFDH